MILASVPENQYLVELIKNVITGKVNTCIPGIIKAFDADTQLAVVQPAIKNRDIINDTIVDYNASILYDVPVQFPASIGAGVAITIPVHAGDPCMLVFSKRALDNWIQTDAGEMSNVENGAYHPRSFDMVDAICIPGVLPSPAALADYDNDNAAIRTIDNKKSVVVGADGVVITSGDNTFSMDYAGRFDCSVEVSGNLSIGTGATGVFTTLGGKTVQVVKGIVVSIT